MVRATFTDGTNVPRIPPVRLGGGVFWRDDNWLARINLLHAFAQNDVAVIAETPTAGYNLLKAEVSYKTKLNPTCVRRARDDCSASSATICSTKTSAIRCPTPRTRC